MLCDRTFRRLSVSSKGSYRLDNHLLRLTVSEQIQSTHDAPPTGVKPRPRAQHHPSFFANPGLYITRCIWKQRNPKSPRVQRQTTRLPQLLPCNRQPSPFLLRLYSVPLFTSVMYILHVWNKSYHAWSNTLPVQWRQCWASFFVFVDQMSFFNGRRSAPRMQQPRWATCDANCVCDFKNIL